MVHAFPKSISEKEANWHVTPISFFQELELLEQFHFLVLF